MSLVKLFSDGLWTVLGTAICNPSSAVIKVFVTFMLTVLCVELTVRIEIHCKVDVDFALLLPAQWGQSCCLLGPLDAFTPYRAVPSQIC